MFFYPSDFCEAIQVTGDTSTSNSVVGLYVTTDDRAPATPNSPVWKSLDGEHFIFNDGGVYGWRIGNENSLTTGNSFCRGKQILMICILQINILNIYLHTYIISR